MPTLQEKFDQAIAEQIAKAVTASEVRMDIALTLAVEIPDSLTADVIEKIRWAKKLVDQAVTGLRGKSLIDYQSEVLEAGRVQVEALQRRKDDEKYQAQFLHRSTERRG